ncbi:hypothetical protein ABZ477_15075 [Microbacterium sp. NPDC019599]|uniref:hypothetical protein n=1 Tax=Microbacterium sp. NPDC019599 TaxID=3154690 RepID=UPI0033F0A31C
MPVVTVLAEPHPDAAGLVSAVADAVAQALGLGDGDVIATFVSAGPTAVSGSAAAAVAWPVVTIHGSDRGTAKMDAARAATEASVRSWMSAHAVEHEGVWSEWLTSTPAVA